MVKGVVDRLADHYANLSDRYRTVDRRADYGRLVVPAGNSEEPLHGWFHLKEAYSTRLFGRVVKDDSWLSDRATLKVLDPFVGVGTTLVSAALGSPGWSGTASGIGIERNPFLHLVASTKASVLDVDTAALAKRVRADGEAILAEARASRARPQLPLLTTLNNRDYYPPGAVRSLVKLRDEIRKLDESVSRNVLLLCVASSLEASGRLRRDGRALRFDPLRQPRPAEQEFQARLDRCVSDLEQLSVRSGPVRVLLGDARRAHQYTRDSFDLALFSPPYPNNIDYTEVYKTEAWLLGMYEGHDAFRAQRHLTLRSHPSVLFAERYSYESHKHYSDVDWLLEPVLGAVPHDRWRRGRERMLKGYVDDMLQVFESTARRVRRGGKCVFVVGNSAHGNGAQRFEVAADLLLAFVAERSGWEVEEIRVARDVTRRGVRSPWLRESVIALRRI